MPAPPVCLTIAGSDSGGGAGIQADLKAFARCGAHGASAITALTAQNTVGVLGVLPVAGEFIAAQIDAVAADISVAAIKVGMLGDEATAHAVAEALARFGDVPVVVDPVMVSESGGTLLAREAESALATHVLPLASVATPNLSEARRLAVHGGMDASQAEHADQEALARAIASLGVGAVVVTGGHTERGVDLLLDASGEVTEIEGEFHPGARSAHGSGCTHSSSLAAWMAHGLELREAARWARVVASEAVGRGVDSVGEGPGPVDALGLGRISAGALGPSPLDGRS